MLTTELEQMTDEELRRLARQIQDILDRRAGATAEAAKERNARERKARAVLAGAGIGLLAGWERPGDRRLYVYSQDSKGKQWGGSGNYPVYYILFLDGSPYQDPGWYCSQPGRRNREVEERIIESVQQALSILGIGIEDAARSSFRFRV